MISPQEIRENLERVQERILAAQQRSGRSGSSIEIVGITKRKSAGVVEAALEAGIKHIGENRIQEIRDKFPPINFGGARRHFVGHLQKNKVKYLPDLVDIVQSVDSVELAGLLNKRYSDRGMQLPVYLQVNISGEESKSGVSPDGLADLTGACLELPALDVSGFMTIGPLSDDIQKVRTAFRDMFKLVEQTRTRYPALPKVPDISMGMSGDFEIAIEEGATHIRLGTILFGART